MPLSEHEKRLLAEMEEALAADDPRLISTFSGKTPSRSRVVAGFGLIVLGIFVLFGGLISQTPPLGIAGFVLALVGAVLAISNLNPCPPQRRVFLCPKSERHKWRVPSLPQQENGERWLKME